MTHREGWSLSRLVMPFIHLNSLWLLRVLPGDEAALLLEDKKPAHSGFSSVPVPSALGSSNSARPLPPAETLAVQRREVQNSPETGGGGCPQRGYYQISRFLGFDHVLPVHPAVLRYLRASGLSSPPPQPQGGQRSSCQQTVCDSLRRSLAGCWEEGDDGDDRRGPGRTMAARQGQLGGQD